MKASEENKILNDSRLAQQHIDDPAAADVFAGLAAVVEDVGVGTARFFQSVGEDGQAVKCTLVVDCLGEFCNGGVIPAKPDALK